MGNVGGIGFCINSQSLTRGSAEKNTKLIVEHCYSECMYITLGCENAHCLVLFVLLRIDLH